MNAKSTFIFLFSTANEKLSSIQTNKFIQVNIFASRAAIVKAALLHQLKLFELSYIVAYLIAAHTVNEHKTVKICL